MPANSSCDICLHITHSDNLTSNVMLKTGEPHNRTFSRGIKKISNICMFERKFGKNLLRGKFWDPTFETSTLKPKFNIEHDVEVNIEAEI